MTEKPTLEQLLAMQPRTYTRRDMLRHLTVGAGALTLAACGIQGSETPSPGDEEETDELTTTSKNGELNFANWPAYIDKLKGESPTLADFEAATGIKVNYKEVINDNVEFFATIRQPLAEGQAIDWDLVVLTDWVISKMVRLGYLETLDHSLLSNFAANTGTIYKDPSYDPKNAHSVPWQSGITGIAYNTELTGRDTTSLMDLFDPAFKGKVGMLTEMRDTMNFALLALGIDPVTATTEDAREAQKMLLEQRDQGIVRKYYGNDYLQPLASGDLALCMAWSGDVLGKTLSGDSKLKFVVPDEGGNLFVDCMAIPQNAANPIDAHEMMDFVYQPEIAAQMTAWINYISPVPAAKPILEKAKDSYSRQVAASPLVFPTPDMEARLNGYKDLDEDEEAEWQGLFDEVTQA